MWSQLIFRVLHFRTLVMGDFNLILCCVAMTKHPFCLMQYRSFLFSFSLHKGVSMSVKRPLDFCARVCLGYLCCLFGREINPRAGSPAIHQVSLLLSSPYDAKPETNCSINLSIRDLGHISVRERPPLSQSRKKKKRGKKSMTEASGN